MASETSPVDIFWFRRDLRLGDNPGFTAALSAGRPVVPIFIFDTEILSELSADDARVGFIHQTLQEIHATLGELGKSFHVFTGNPTQIWSEILNRWKVVQVHFNRDYEPYAIQRDEAITQLVQQHNGQVLTYKDHVIFEPDEILKADGTPYTVYTPYKNRWLERWARTHVFDPLPVPDLQALVDGVQLMPSLAEVGFKASSIKVKPINWDAIQAYHQHRDFPARAATTNLSPHLRFGTVGIRQAMAKSKANATFQSELIWRSFFIQILFHFPHVVTRSFKSQYDQIQWRNQPEEFQRWKDGQTGVPLVDAGMRELNNTGYMHNRVRMVVASFLCKHLLIDWRWGEAYFAAKLLDFELASNNGNWQWAAGTGCDAAPYFRVFNPITQQQRFDPQGHYVGKWVPEFNDFFLPEPMVDLKQGRLRAIETYKAGLGR